MIRSLLLCCLPFLVDSFFIQSDPQEKCNCSFSNEGEKATAKCSPLYALSDKAFVNCQTSRNLRHLRVAFEVVQGQIGSFNLNENVFDNMPYITYLNLSGIGLNNLTSNHFSELNNLTELDLSNNKLTYLPIGIFTNLTHLKKLYLNKNNIGYLNPSVLRPLEQLIYLNLSDNNIHFFNQATFSNFKELKETDIRGNPLKCHCDNINLILNSTIKADNFCSVDSPKINCSFIELNVFTLNETIRPFYSDITVDCSVKSSHNYSVIWVSPTGVHFASRPQQPWVPGEAFVNKTFNIPPRFFQILVTVHENHSLTISHLRGFFAGNWSCVAFALNENVSSTIHIKLMSYIERNFPWSLCVGFSSAGSLLLIGIIVGIMRYLDETRCLTVKIDRSNKMPVMEVIPVPDDKDPECGDLHAYALVPSTSVDGDASCPQECEEDILDDCEADVDLVFRDEGMALQYAEAFEHLASCSADPLHFGDRLMELRRRMRRDVGPKMSIMRSKMRRAHMESKQRMQNFRSSSTVAAQKVKESLHNGMDQVRFQMKSVAQLCGAVNLGQTISLLSVYTDDDNKQIERHIKKFVFK